MPTFFCNFTLQYYSLLKLTLMKDFIFLVVLAVVAYFLLQNFETASASAVTSDNFQWSGDDTLKVMIVKDSAYIVK